ncbi:MAG TPA: DUF1015 family protein [Chitinophagaceae bacterium]|nr:DUF1015 family protein [Chitinophagaceae bacterium]
MITITPFTALRPEAQYAKLVASKPYDVLSSKEAKIEAEGNPYSFLHITKSEIDLPEEMDPYSQKVYEKAKENLDAFISRNVLFKENKACYYIYQLVMPGKPNIGNDHIQTGLVCCSSLDDYQNNLIKKHEFTRPEKEQDRINHIKTTGAQTGNVFLAYKNVHEIDEIVDKWKKERSAVYIFVSDDIIQHAIWIINDAETIAKISSLFKEKVPCTYIADGHHRAASAAKAKSFFAENNSHGEGNVSANSFLTTLFPANQLKIMEYNRVVKDLNKLTDIEFLEQIAENFLVEKKDTAFLPEEPNTFGMYMNYQWYKLTSNISLNNNDPIQKLDISILHNYLFQPILGIQDQRTDKKIDFIGGIRGLVELENRVNTGEMVVAFSLYPVSVQQLFDIADSGNVMPPKSTWFEPKLRDGLLTHLID